MEDTSKAYAAQMLQIIDKLVFLEKNQVFKYGKELKLYPSEIHLLLLMSDGQTSNSTEMARKLGITKGAVSQTISRLVRKGILNKNKDPYKKNELTAVFTALGNKVLIKCHNLRKVYYDHFLSYLSSLPGNDRETIGRFLYHFEEELMSISDAKFWKF